MNKQSNTQEERKKCDRVKSRQVSALLEMVRSSLLFFYLVNQLTSFFCYHCSFTSVFVIPVVSFSFLSFHLYISPRVLL